MAPVIHVVSKLNNAQHAAVQVPVDPLPTLAPSSLRLRTTLISLSSNNFSYARGGTVFHWWETYPVLSSLPPPYNNTEEWGIVPAWGYATVLESTIPSITPGSLLWGFWPTSSHTIDLQLQPSAPAGHWAEVSEGRRQLMTVYNRYVEAVSADPVYALCMPLWQAGYLLNTRIFPSSANVEPIHPLGAVGIPWTAQDGDLSSAVVVSLSASSKTGRSFAWQLARDRDVGNGGPLGLLQVTSAPGSLAKFKDTALPMKAVGYGEAWPAEWIAGLKPARAVVVDFGASDEVLHAVVDALGEVVSKVTIVAVGSEAKVYSAEELLSRVASGKSLGKVQMNTSGVKDRAMELDGAEKYTSNINKAWARCTDEDGLGEMKLKYFEGVKGSNGIEGAWQGLCDRTFVPGEGILVRLDGQ